MAGGGAVGFEASQGACGLWRGGADEFGEVAGSQWFGGGGQGAVDALPDAGLFVYGHAADGATAWVYAVSATAVVMALEYERHYSEAAKEAQRDAGRQTAERVNAQVTGSTVRADLRTAGEWIEPQAQRQQRYDGSATNDPRPGSV